MWTQAWFSQSIPVVGVVLSVIMLRKPSWHFTDVCIVSMCALFKHAASLVVFVVCLIHAVAM